MPTTAKPRLPVHPVALIFYACCLITLTLVGFGVGIGVGYAAFYDGTLRDQVQRLTISVDHCEKDHEHHLEGEDDHDHATVTPNQGAKETVFPASGLPMGSVAVTDNKHVKLTYHGHRFATELTSNVYAMPSPLFNDVRIVTHNDCVAFCAKQHGDDLQGVVVADYTYLVENETSRSQVLVDSVNTAFTTDMPFGACQCLLGSATAPVTFAEQQETDMRLAYAVNADSVDPSVAFALELNGTASDDEGNVFANANKLRISTRMHLIETTSTDAASAIGVPTIVEDAVIIVVRGASMVRRLVNRIRKRNKRRRREPTIEELEEEILDAMEAVEETQKRRMQQVTTVVPPWKQLWNVIVPRDVRLLDNALSPVFVNEDAAMGVPEWPIE